MNQFLIILAFLLPVFSFAQEAGKPLPKWKKGILDLHHINTGRGDAAFYILPDGTTVLFDAGEEDPTDPRTTSPRNSAVHPNDSKKPYEWIAHYIAQMVDQPQIDYAIISHFHDDHFGIVYNGIGYSSKGNYALTGITGLGDLIPIRTLIDRGYPEYNYPYDMKQLKKVSGGKPDLQVYAETMENYWKFIEYHKKNSNMRVEQLVAGRNNQIKLKNDSISYPDFKIRNIKSNGMVWTGKDNEVLNCLENALLNEIPENQLSLAIRIDYGDFRYYTGGDNSGIADLGQPAWKDVETPMSKAIGEVDVAVMDHHGNRDAHNEYNIQVMRPRVWIEQSWSSDHPGHEVLRRVTSQYLYQGDRDLFTTNMLEANRLVIGEAIDKAYKSTDGHILVRVMPGGKEYFVIILDDESENTTVKAVFGPYQSKKKNQQTTTNR